MIERADCGPQGRSASREAPQKRAAGYPLLRLWRTAPWPQLGRRTM